MKYTIDGSTLSAIADAIRLKTGGSSLITPANMATEIAGISGGGDVLSGNLAPSSSLGQNGDVYIQTVSEGNELRSSGTQWINTGIVDTSVYGYSLSFRPISLANSYQSYVSGALDNFTIGAYNSVTECYVRVRGAQTDRLGISTQSPNVLTKHDTSNPLGNKGSTITIFSAPGGSRASSMGLRRLILYNIDGNPIADYVPIRDTSDVACLYDLISSTYLYNSGSGLFTYTEVTSSVIGFDSVFKKVNGAWVSVSL